MNAPDFDSDEARILIIEDGEAVFQTLEQLLSERGFRCAFCGDAAEALVATPTFSPELILLNPEVPGLDGCQFTEALKASDQTARIPVVFISSLQETHIRKKAFRSDRPDFGRSRRPSRPGAY